MTSQRVGADGGAVWHYKDGDDLATVTGINYITNGTDLGLVSGDKVIHYDSTNTKTTDLTAVAWANGTASGALCSAIEPIGETSIALQSAGTGTVLIGDIITFDNGDETEYRVTTGDTDISDGGTLVITPALVVATAVGTKIKVKSDVFNLSSGDGGSPAVASSPAAYLISPNESGSTFLFDAVAGQSFTLPTAVVGLKYRFVTTVNLTSNAFAVLTSTATAGDFMVGSVHGAIEGAATDEVHFANGTTHLGFSANKTTTGGLIGSTLEVEAISDTLWLVSGVQSCTATPATPFTT
jgi:hypothetical protein